MQMLDDNCCDLQMNQRVKVERFTYITIDVTLIKLRTSDCDYTPDSFSNFNNKHNIIHIYIFFVLFRRLSFQRS